MRSLLRLLLFVLPLAALYPVARLAADWIEVAQITGETPRAAPARGFDWVRWEDRDGSIVAAYVHPGGPADEAGIEPGAVLFQLEFMQLFSAEDVKRIVEGIPPGELLAYDVRQPDASATEAVEVEIARYPTFLYPLSGGLWQASLWGFALAALLHGLGLVLVAPMARRTRRARRTTALFAAATLWVAGNFARLLAVTLLGPPTDGLYGVLFDGLTLAALGGWILFPALLLHSVLADLPLMRLRPDAARWAVFLPPLLFGAAVIGMTGWGAVGPLTLDTMIAPILFYVCLYVASAAALSLGAQRGRLPREGRPDVPAAATWSRVGSAGVMVLAGLGALSVLGIVPVFGTVPDGTVAALIVSLQLLSLLPVGIVSVATLRHGRLDTVVPSALVTLTAALVLFAVLFGGLVLIEQGLGDGDWRHAFAASAFVTTLAAAAAAAIRSGWPRVARWIETDRQRARAQLRRFGERLRFILDADRLTEATAEAVGTALDATTVVLILRDPADPARRLRSTFRPIPPHLTEADVAHLWHTLHTDGRLWAADGELSEGELAPEIDRLLRRHGVSLALPVGGEHDPVGLLLIGPRSARRAVYTLEDVAQVRTLAAQVALATERLALIEREKALVRQSAEAKLTALRAQINPHFLFNTLNTIAALIAERPAEAEAAVERLAAIFRYVLQTDHRAFVPLREEVGLVLDVLALEQARFGERLTVEHDWDEAVLDVPVPAFALQTLVENAVQHGIQPLRGGGTVRLEGRCADGLAVLSVHDTGTGLPEDVGDDGLPAFFGIGLTNVADRLERLYARRDLLRLSSGPHGGTLAELRIPLSPDAAHAAR